MLSIIINTVAIPVLLITAMQDFKAREIHWIVFPSLAILFIAEGVLSSSLADYLKGALYNLVFLSIQGSVLIIYCLLRKNSPVTIVNTLVGLGDILFLLVLVLAFSNINFIVFYTLGLLLTLIIWLIIRPLLSGRKDEVPLTGFLSVFLAVILIFEDFSFGFNRFSNIYLIGLFNG
jgi:hypothetical protein